MVVVMVTIDYIEARGEEGRFLFRSWAGTFTLGAERLFLFQLPGVWKIRKYEPIVEITPRGWCSV